MAKKLVIVMANTDPRNGEELGAPIFQASVAAAMEYEVDVICTATAGRLMKKGVAEKLLGQKVHLDVRVKTTPGWFDDDARLVDLGYGDDGATPKKRAQRKTP